MACGSASEKTDCLAGDAVQRRLRKLSTEHDVRIQTPGGTTEDWSCARCQESTSCICSSTDGSRGPGETWKSAERIRQGNDGFTCARCLTRDCSRERWRKQTAHTAATHERSRNQSRAHRSRAESGGLGRRRGQPHSGASIRSRRAASKATGGAARPLTADYVLVYRNPKLAVVEAKAWDEELTEGVAQAKNYAGKLAIRFTYSTNGQGIYGIDMQDRHRRRVAALSRRRTNSGT